ncbi:copper oxidase [Emcibacter sp. SYSU 3D8]|uniref:multicopper oxidase family protein n=1 Tax=Emcibacter sp. SYSU 3D8 TaxID=3133969 RepID=UPI0031FE4597
MSGINRRQALGLSGAALAAGVLVSRDALAQHDHHMPPASPAPPPPAATSRRGRVTTPGGDTLSFRTVGGVKIFHLVAEPVAHVFAPGLNGQCWGYNGRVHGPTIEAVEGDRVRVYVTNKLPAPTTIHWHGIILPNGMDGVGGLNQPTIKPGETFLYEWTFRQHGTFMYHPHHDEMTQMAMGLMGLVVVHPREARPADRDYALMLSTWKVTPGTTRPDPNEMTDFNVLTMNGLCYPGTPPLLARTGDLVRIRIGNLSAMDHHPIHLRGHNFRVTETDGGPIPRAGQWPETTVLVPTGSTRTIEFTAEHPGDWAMHCHMTHHLMNQMGHDLPNMIGADAGKLRAAIGKAVPDAMVMGTSGMDDMGEHGMHMEMPENTIAMAPIQGPHDAITMGGMFTILKVRDDLTDNPDPGWYEQPRGSASRLASADELKRDGIERT